MVNMRHQELRILGSALFVSISDGFANTADVLERVDGDDNVTDIRVDNLLSEAILQQSQDGVLRELRHVAHVIGSCAVELGLKGRRIAFLVSLERARIEGHCTPARFSLSVW